MIETKLKAVGGAGESAPKTNRRSHFLGRKTRGRIYRVIDINEYSIVFLWL